MAVLKSRPEVMSLTANPSEVPVSRNADVVADAQDPSNDPLTYERRPDRGAIFGEGAQATMTPTVRGSRCPREAST